MSAGQPLQPTQGVKRHAARPKLSKEAHAALRTQRQGKNENYNSALNEADKAISNIIESVAVSHQKSIRRVEATLKMGHDPITNAHRKKTSAWNAFCWKKMQERHEEGLRE